MKVGVKKLLRAGSMPARTWESGGQEVAENGYGTSKSVGSACSGDGSLGKV